MLHKVLPKRFKTHLRSEFRRLLAADLPENLQSELPARVAEQVNARLPEMLQVELPPRLLEMLKAQLPDRVLELVRLFLPQLLPAREGFFPIDPPVRCAVVPKNPPACPLDDATGLPIPPPELWSGYGAKPEVYLQGGQLDVQNMRQIVEASGFPLASAGRIMEWGCSAGRMMRWLHDLANVCEIWGTDVTATHIRWCKQYLSPPFHFATTTTHPHLPFEDRYFGFIFAGSVFTHLDELADSWFQELRRVLRPGGRLYVTIHDRHTVDILNHELWHWLSGYVRSLPEYQAASQSDFGMLSLNGDDWTREFVFYDAEYLGQRLDPFFHVLSVNKEAYGYQTAVLLERRH
jgi:SAM-dependent methyltransferase